MLVASGGRLEQRSVFGLYMIKTESYRLIFGAIIRKVDSKLAVHNFVVIEVSHC